MSSASPEQHIIEVLSHGGEQTIEELATDLELTPSAVRQHVTALEEEKLVSHGARSNGRRGRPRRYYSLTTAGEQLLPGLSGEMAIVLVDELLALYPSVVLPVIRARLIARAETRLEQLPDDATDDDRRGLCLEVFAEAGFRPGYQESDDASDVLTFHHCPIRHMADVSAEVCTAELEALRLYYPGADVERTEHRLAGDRHCAFRIASRAAKERDASA